VKEWDRQIEALINELGVKGEIDADEK